MRPATARLTIAGMSTGPAETQPRSVHSSADAERQPPARGGIGRRLLVGFLVVLFAVLTALTTVVTWTHRAVLDTPTYVDTIKSVGKDPAVVTALSQRITNQIYAALDPQAVVADSLPPKAKFLAGPITTGARSYVEQGVAKVISSDAFQQLWVSANKFAHTQLVAVLRGDTKVVQATNGNVVLNVVPLLAAAMTNLGTFASDVVGRPVTLPQVTGTELPSAACAKVSTAIGRPLPSTCGQIVLFRAKNLTEARRLVQAFDRAVVALLIVTPLTALLALVLTRRRRRTLLQLTIGAMLGLVVVRRSGFWLQDHLINSAPPADRAARAAIIHDVLNGLFDVMWWMLLAGVIIVAVAWVTGPYRSAVATRRVASGVADLTVAAARGRPARDLVALAFLRRHFDLLRISGVVVALLLLVAINLNFISFLVIVALLALYELGLARLRPPESVSLPGDQRPSVPTVPTPRA